MADDSAGPPQVAPPSALDFFGGGALGALLGLLTGLSTTPVVAGVIAGIVALLGGVFGASDRLAGPSQAGLRRLAAFALAAVIVTPVSIWMRTHNTFGVSVEERLDTLTRLGITKPAERLEWMKLVHFGIAPENVKLPAIQPGNGGLFSFEDGSPLCTGLYALETRGGTADDFAKVMSGNPMTLEIRDRISLLESPSDRAVLEFRPASDDHCNF